MVLRKLGSPRCRSLGRIIILKRGLWFASIAQKTLPAPVMFISIHRTLLDIIRTIVMRLPQRSRMQRYVSCFCSVRVLCNRRDFRKAAETVGARGSLLLLFVMSAGAAACVFFVGGDGLVGDGLVCVGLVCVGLVGVGLVGVVGC